ncbi:MAG: hypothetical protein EZS28_047033 [Streblomastix strix]|uniref:Uncharacterized protein n=1 Tax=Streblomastix strix TaxID=222440 RepID=A0A5J4TI68_9EUKA|nr:MAG: hypothetical protein EZS28_047033 [Streblomastix strix]
MMCGFMVNKSSIVQWLIWVHFLSFSIAQQYLLWVLYLYPYKILSIASIDTFNILKIFLANLLPFLAAGRNGVVHGKWEIRDYLSEKLELGEVQGRGVLQGMTQGRSYKRGTSKLGELVVGKVKQLIWGKFEIRVNNEGKLIQQNYFDNSQRYNANARLDEASMDLGSRAPVITQEQIENEMLNDGTQRQRQRVNQELNEMFPIETVHPMPQSTIFERDAPETTIAQERLEELRQQQLLGDIVAAQNLNTVYDIGALDWGRPPVNDIYGRSQFPVHKTGYKYDQFGNPQAYMKMENPLAGKLGVKKKVKMKKNYIPTSQLLSTSSAQENLAKSFRKGGMKQKKK